MIEIFVFVSVTVQLQREAARGKDVCKKVFSRGSNVDGVKGKWCRRPKTPNPRACVNFLLLMKLPLGFPSCSSSRKLWIYELISLWLYSCEHQGQSNGLRAANVCVTIRLSNWIISANFVNCSNLHDDCTFSSCIWCKAWPTRKQELNQNFTLSGPWLGQNWSRIFCLSTASFCFSYTSVICLLLDILFWWCHRKWCWVADKAELFKRTVYQANPIDFFFF